MESSLKSMLQNVDVAYGAWFSLPDTISAEAAAHSGFDYICIDMQHGLLDYQATLNKLQVLSLASAVPIVRVPANEPSIICKALDAGAMAIIVPLINTPEEAQAAVAASRYPPEGNRSMGPKRPMTLSGLEYLQQANGAISVIPMIETADGLKNIDEIVKISGIDAVYIGPFDLHLGLGLTPNFDSDEALFNDALNRILESCRNVGITAGVHATAQLAAKRREQGFEMITVASDFSLLRQGLQDALHIAKK
jgi:4-hydroxy-2-oxoheptanedioate aldolase